MHSEWNERPPRKKLTKPGLAGAPPCEVGGQLYAQSCKWMQTATGSILRRLQPSSGHARPEITTVLWPPTTLLPTLLCSTMVVAPAFVGQPRSGSRVALHRWRNFVTSSRAPGLYELLGVSTSATPQELKNGFLEQVRVHHPDINGHPDAAATFNEIQSAFDLLINSTTRREYDASTVGLQPDWVYKDSAGVSTEAGQYVVPLAAMTEAELLKRAEYIDERIRAHSANISSLQKKGATITLGGVQSSRLMAELVDYSEQRAELRNALSNIAAARIRRGGGNRRRKRLSERAQRPETAWYAPPPGVPQDVVDMTRTIIAELRRNPAAPDLEASFQPMRSSAKTRHKEADCATSFTSETHAV